MTQYLADTSIWAWANQGSRPDIARKLAERLERGEICTCVPIALEVMHRAETGDEYERLFAELLEPLEWLPLTDDAAQRGLDVQRELAAYSHGRHRRPVSDYLIAAVAEAESEAILWFFDRDLDLICEHTGQPFDAERSTGAGT